MVGNNKAFEASHVGIWDYFMALFPIFFGYFWLVTLGCFALNVLKNTCIYLCLIFDIQVTYATIKPSRPVILVSGLHYGTFP